MAKSTSVDSVVTLAITVKRQFVGPATQLTAQAT
jgi:hypothetical protein